MKEKISEKRYSIDLTESQVRLLSKVCDNQARAIIGQLENSLGDLLYRGAEKHKDEGEVVWDLRDEYIDKLNEIKRVVWKQKPYQSYGVGYSKESDTLFDIHEVLRQQLWKDSEDKPSFTVDSYEPFHWNKENPLIEVKEIKE